MRGLLEPGNAQETTNGNQAVLKSRVRSQGHDADMQWEDAGSGIWLAADMPEIHQASASCFLAERIILQAAFPKLT